MDCPRLTRARQRRTQRGISVSRAKRAKPPGAFFRSPKFLPYASQIIMNVMQSPFYSAPSIFAVFRNLVQEIWFKKYGSRNMVRVKWLTRKKGVFIPYIHKKSGSRKVVDQKKNLSLQNHFSRTTFLHFSRKVVAE